MSKSNPFDLPPPWNPGYEMPQNVDDEGIERHAYTTAWAPRGSFDDPKVGYAGYAVPEYVKEEGYGVGAMTTRWAPRGTYYGPRIPHWLDRPSAGVIGRKPMPGGATMLKIQTMAGIERNIGSGSAPITAYGLDAAKALIETVKMMPPDVRKRQLRLALDKIDPKLWARAEAGADAESKLGVPAEVALERGLGAAMSYGLAKELVDLGRGKKPPEQSQLGACLPCAVAMLGASEMELVPAHWERARAGQACAPPPAGVAPRAGFCWVPAGMQEKVEFRASSTRPESPPPADQVFANIGPFLIPVTAGAWRDHRTLTAEKKQYVDENIAIAARAGGISIAEMKTGRYPFVKFKAGPTGNESWGLYYQEDRNGTIVAYHRIPDGEASQLGGVVGDIGGALKDAAKAVGGAVWSVLKKIWKGIKWVVLKVVHFVIDAHKWMAKMTCKLTSTPGVVQGAQAVAMAAPNPYTVGVAAGITVTKMICDKVYGSAEEAAAAAAEAEAAAAAAAAAAADAAAAEKRKKMMPLLLLGGAGIVGAVLLFGKKK